MAFHLMCIRLYLKNEINKNKRIIMANMLPVWDLSALYNGIDDIKITEDLNKIETETKEFAKKYQGKLKDLDFNAVYQSIKEYEAMSDFLGRIMTFGSLTNAKQQDDAAISRFWQGLRERITQIVTHSVFYTLEINKLGDEIIEQWLRNENIDQYHPWINEIRKQKPYQLSDEVEQILMEKNNTATAAWVRLYDETFAAYRFTMNGKKVGISDVLNALSSSKPEKRKNAALALSQGLKENEDLVVRIYNTIIADKSMEDNWRGFKSPIASMNLNNNVEDDVVDALATAVESNYNKLSHRYYAYKARKFGVEKLKYWDRNAPYPEQKEKNWSFDDGKEFILKAYGGFSPKVAELAEGFFDDNWIDAKPKAGKYSGAFAHPSVPSHHPYILVNWYGKERDLMTLAHELGHGVHQCLAAKQGALMADTPLTLAETASVFGEMLTFRQLLAETTDNESKQLLLASKVEDMLNTVVRQIAFHQFETEIHALRKQGEVSAEKISEIWMRIQKDSLGDTIEFDENYMVWWAYVSHFFHVPFYVYAYAFGDCLVNSLYQVYLEQPDGFEEKYIKMLKAGGTKHHTELLAPFGLDATQPDFWNKGLKMISDFIDELEMLENK